METRSILIVGGSSSVGRAIVERFRRDGAKLLCTYRQDPVDFGPGVRAVALDLTIPESIERFVGEVVPGFGQLDLAVLLPGILAGRDLRSYDEGEIDRIITVNLTGQVKLIRRLLPHLRHGSQILMMSSISAHRGSYDPVYAASKGAILSLVRSLATWLAPDIRANAIAPGLIEGSTMYQQFTPERRAVHLSQIPMRRFLQAEDLAEVIRDLAQPHWSHLNGACIDLNGGQYVR